MLFALLIALAPLAQDHGGDRTYRQLFDAGLVALEAGDQERADTLFRAAGRRAPKAALWRAYCSDAPDASPTSAQGEDTSARGTSEWATVQVNLAADNACALSATGERLLFGHAEAALVDVESGALIARLQSRLPTRPNSGPLIGHLRWKFDVSGRVVVGAMALAGDEVGLDVRDASTGRPLDLRGAFEFVMTSGTRFEWYATGEEVPECDFVETSDLHSEREQQSVDCRRTRSEMSLARPLTGPRGEAEQFLLSLSAEGTLRCHRVPLASAERTAFGLPALSATLSGDAGLAVLRNQRVPTELQVIDRRTERVLLERSPAGYDSLLSPNGTRLFIMDATEIRCVDLETREDRWAAPIEANATWGTSAVYAFLGQQLVEVAPSGPVRAFDPETGERKELIQLDPAPKGQLDGATFARDGALLVVLAVDETVCYDVRTGKKLWAAGVGRWFADPSHGTLDAAEELCLVVDSSAQPRVVRLATGERFGPAAEGPAAAQGAVAIRSVIAVDGGKAAIVALATGELRRVELADGATSARSGNAIGWVTELDPRTRGAHVLAMNHGAKARLIDAESLEAVAGATLEESVRWETFSADGRFGVASQPNPKRMRLVRLTEDLSGEVVFDQARHAAAAAFSLSGDVLALVIDGRLELRDGRTGEARADFDLSSDVQFNEAAFHRENELVLGTSGVDYGPYGAEVIDTNSGKVLAKVHFDDPFGGGTVMHIHSSPAEGLVILTASACGTVEAFDDSTWKSRYAHPTNGGNWGTLVVRHEPGASVAAISGMTAQHARLFEVATGKIVAWGKNVEGLFDLALVDEGRRIIGVRNQRLAVLDAATYETLYTREEAADGNAWLLRDGVRRAAPGSHAIRADPVHIIHDGWSAPIDSFDAWLYDPLARGEPSLVSLPLLPVIQAVRRVPSEADAVLEALEITAHSREPILGAVIGWPDRDETFVAFAAQANLPDAPTPAEAWRLGLLGLPSGWTSIRLVAESGALSRAHRAR